jgi:hypothetical protein
MSVLVPKGARRSREKESVKGVRNPGGATNRVRQTRESGFPALVTLEGERTSGEGLVRRGGHGGRAWRDSEGGVKSRRGKVGNSTLPTEARVRKTPRAEGRSKGDR